MQPVGKVRQSMGAAFQVKTRLISALLALCSVSASGAETAAHADTTAQGLTILKSVRIAQTAQHMTLEGNLRTGPVSVPFRLVIEGPVIRYDFKDPDLSLVLRLGEKSSQLQEITKSGAEKVATAHLDAKVRGSDITLEDLAMRFLYWPNATFLGEETKLLRRCWKVEAQPGETESQYSKVVLWVDEQSGALLQAEALDKAGKLVRRFSVKSVQKSEGVWILKQMRIEAPGAKEDKLTYLEISGVAK